MKVAYFTESLPPNTDGVVKTLCHLVDSLDENDVDFRFYSPVKPDDSYPWRDKVRKVASVPFALYSYYRVGLPYFHGIKQELDEFKPDLVHIVSQTLLGMYGMQYGRRVNIPVVSSYHTNFVSYFQYYGFKKAEKLGWQYLTWFHNQCDLTYAPSPSTVNELLEKGIHDVELWQRGIELDKFSPDHRSTDLRRSIGAEDKPILLFVGRLVKEKDLDDLIAADQILKARGNDLKIVIVGDGPMKEECHRRLPDAHLTGYQYGTDLARWYASSDIFAFPSTTETFGNVILEAFASGIPAVGVNKGGVADIIHHAQDGFIAQANDPVDFSDHVEKLIKDPPLRFETGVKARLTARSYSWSAINQALLRSYENIIAN